MIIAGSLPRQVFKLICVQLDANWQYCLVYSRKNTTCTAAYKENIKEQAYVELTS